MGEIMSDARSGDGDKTAGARAPRKERIPVEITNPRLTAAIWRTYGMAIIFEALKEVDEKYAKLPGFHMAFLICEKYMADARANMAGMSIREVAKAGHDITQVNVYTEITKNKPMLHVEAIDLVDVAEGDL
jgi:hypothetical protein